MKRLWLVIGTLAGCGDDRVDASVDVDVLRDADAEASGCEAEPVARCHPEVLLELTGAEATVTTALLDDGSTSACGGALTLTLLGDPAPGGAIDWTLDCTQRETTRNVTLAVREGERIATCTSAVSVRDVAPPSVVCAERHDVGSVLGEVAVVVEDFVVSVTDNCAAEDLVVTASPEVLRCAAPGELAVPLVVTAADATGNAAECASTAIVQCASEAR